MDNLKPVVWLKTELKTPPLSKDARVEAGVLILMLQEGDRLGMPRSRPMPAIGPRCHELRIVDENGTWRVMYRTDPDAVIIMDAFSKKTRATPKRVIERCKRRLKAFESDRKRE